MKKYLFAILLLLMCSMGLSEDVLLIENGTDDDVAVTLPLTQFGQVVITCDSNASDSSYGTFSSQSFSLGGSPAVHGYYNYAGVTDCTHADTIVLHCITAAKRDVTTPDTFLVDTLVEVGATEFWLGKWDGWTGTDSVITGGELWFDGEIWDTCSDSANHGTTVKYELHIEADRAGYLE